MELSNFAFFALIIHLASYFLKTTAAYKQLLLSQLHQNFKQTLFLQTRFKFHLGLNFCYLCFMQLVL